MQGEFLYSEKMYGQDEAEKKAFELPVRFVDLTKYVPPYLPEFEEMAAIYEAQGYEIGRAHALMDSLMEQGIPSLATWDLEHWEKLLALEISEEATDEARRALIIAKLAGTETLTPVRIVQLAQSVTGMEAMVEEVTSEYRFTVIFIGGYGIPNHIKLFRRLLDDLKPAHLAYEITYRYVIWDELAGKIWDDLTAYTWDGLRINQKIPYVSWDSLAVIQPSWRSLRRESWNTVTQIQEAKN